MNRIRIGVRLESLGLPFRRALAEAQRLGVGGVQVDAAGDLSPNRLSQSGRRELLHLLRAHNLELTALGCPLRRGLDSAEDQQPRIEHVRKVMSLSYDLGPRVVVVQAGPVPEKDDDPRADRLIEALTDLGRHGDRVGAVLALETGLEDGATLRKFLDRFDTGSLAANLDPGNLLLHGFNPYESARALAGKVAHADAKDARRAGTSRVAQEVPLGHGDLDWMAFLDVLGEIEYRGWLTVEREAGDHRLADVEAGVKLLRRLLG
ncbi:MAG TPA: sugar phosphate isomerase/epimerase family protein [Gemmataceae bacterium]|nr:sugar phosphate isomerase/epimerase family protein [Gemmataceae bacterium]